MESGAGLGTFALRVHVEPAGLRYRSMEDHKDRSRVTPWGSRKHGLRNMMHSAGVRDWYPGLKHIYHDAGQRS